MFFNFLDELHTANIFANASQSAYENPDCS